MEDVASEESEQDAALETDVLYNVDEELKGLAVANPGLAPFALLNSDLLTKLCGCQREQPAQKIVDRWRTTINDLFKNSSK